LGRVAFWSDAGLQRLRHFAPWQFVGRANRSATAGGVSDGDDVITADRGTNDRRNPCEATVAATPSATRISKCVECRKQ
jgi:hypothetical protein